ncbi:mono-functional DNA-alkylating methyl methanesulfonate N-term-domain-containing protein [Lipomyces orientalis]|uniref:Mono-functional DNA-alkylating methyl methanesulfonate N-term-domain-containing protein n=1 Tax=Lipomyces orientalis TaxID=1233043 RepID=A0ACC3TPC5_9ASCO
MRASDVISAKLTLASTPFPREIMMNAHLPTAYFYPSFPQPSRLNNIPAFAYIISHSEIAHFLDYFYVAFDNGDIYIVAISSTNSLEIGYYTRISGTIGPAFVVVEGDFVTGRQDLVFAGGDMSSGGIYTASLLVDLPPSTPPSIPSPNKTGLPMDFSEHAQISRLWLQFCNWAPVFDCHILKTADPFRDRLFVTSGFQNEGGISQVRYGVEGQIVAGGPKFKGYFQLVFWKSETLLIECSVQPTFLHSLTPHMASSYFSCCRYHGNRGYLP